MVSRAVVLGMLLLAVGGVLPQRPLPAQELGRLEWLSGCWEGTLGREGRTTYEEQWTSPRGGVMLGVARTVRGDSARGFEYVRIVERAGGLFYVAQPGGRPPVEFALGEHGDARATFTNPQHDHPKWIQYQRTGADSLVARIAGDVKGQQIDAEYRLRSVPCAGRR